MDFIQRLILLIAVVYTVINPTNALAGTHAPIYIVQLTGATDTPVAGYTLNYQAKCQNYLGGTGNTYRFPNTPTNSQLMCIKNGSDYTTFNTTAYCGANVNAAGTYPNQTCADTCVAPNSWNVTTQSCQPPACVAGEVVSSGYYDGGLNAQAAFPNIACINSCEVLFEGTWPYSQSKQANGMHYYGYGQFAKDGFACSSGTNPPTPLTATPKDTDQQAADAAAASAAAAAAQKTAAAAAAAAAKTAADKAAAAIAAATAKATADAAAVAQKAADAAKAKADEAAAASAAAAASTTATQAEKDAASAASTAAAATAAQKAAEASTAGQTAATAAGQAASTAKPDSPKDAVDFCELHPNSVVCKNSSINAGFCSGGKVTGFTCDGDATTCEIARNEVQSYCFITSKDDTLTAKFNEAKNDNPANNNSLPQNASTIALPSSLNATSPYGGQCNSDLTIGFNGASVTLPFSAWCGVLQSLGYLFLACAYITAAIILGGVV